MAGEDIVEVSTFTAAVHVPLTNEDVSAATLKIPLQSLANRTKNLNDRTTTAEGSVSDLDDAVETLTGAGIQAFPFVSADPASSGQWDASIGNGTWTQIGVAGLNRPLICPINLPTGSVITRIDVWISGGTHLATPGVWPAWYLYSLGNTGGTLLESKSDATAWPGYDALHAISKNSLSITIDNANLAYVLQCYGEAAANALPNVTQVFVAYVYFDPIF